jgi:hypothetical protein
MNAIDRPGTYRGKLSEWGVSETKNGYPQFVFKATALEYYDTETGAYVSWAEYEQEIDAYLCLFTKDKNGQWAELLGAKQVKKALGWSGLDFESLANGRYGETLVLFRVEEHEYNGVLSLQVSWLDAADANPVKTMPKYDTAKLKDLTAKMGGALSATAASVAPAKPAGKPATPPKGKKPLPKSDVAPKPGAPLTATPPPASPAPAAPAPSAAPAATPVLEMTKDSAWAAVNDMKAATVTDEKLAEVWVAEATKIGKAEEQFTPVDWWNLKEAVLAATAKF